VGQFGDLPGIHKVVRIGFQQARVTPMATQSSAALVFNDNEEVLLVLREDARIWALPAGRREAGETFEQAAIRETGEETGYSIELERLIGG
jgi:8-oxo-dGTP diphosphatase